VIVSLGPLKFDIGSMDDDRTSPTLGFTSVFVPQAWKK